MTAVLWTFILILLIVLAALGIKVFLLRKSARQLREGLHERLSQESNNLLSISSRDREMRRLASSLNQELRALRRERLRYQQGDRELKDGVANMSHDLRTPLTAICGYLELLKRQPLSPDASRYLGQIENRTEAMKRLTEELFRYSVVNSNEEIHPQPVDLNRALEESLLAFYGTFEKRGIVPQHKAAGPQSHALAGPRCPKPDSGKHFGKCFETQRRGCNRHAGPRWDHHFFQPCSRFGSGHGRAALRPILHCGDGTKLHWARAFHCQASHRSHGRNHWQPIS